MPCKITKQLLAVGALSSDQVRFLEKESQQSGQSIEHLLKSTGFVTPAALAEVASTLGQIPMIDLRAVLIDPELLARWPKEAAIAHQAIPLSCEVVDGQLTLEVAMVHPRHVTALDALRGLFQGHQVTLCKKACTLVDFTRALEEVYGHGITMTDLLEAMEEADTESLSFEEVGQNPVVKLANFFLLEAVRKGVSDIHFEPFDRFVRVRYRIDGGLFPVITFHKDHWPFLVNRLKILAHLDIAEARLPQNGRLTRHLCGRDVDFRVSVHPTVHGESVVVRVLDHAHECSDLKALGFDEQDLKAIIEAVQNPYGLVVVTGPTGSGKTTTLYALLDHLRSEASNIMTLEQPVEYKIPGVRQTEITEGAAFGFGEGIRSILRHDPDIILVGEIRDTDTARMALRAAITGHQVLTTLHTQDAAGVLPRLYELGVSRDLLSGHIAVIIAQRLVRRLCRACRQVCAPSVAEVEVFKAQGIEPPKSLFHAPGCETCDGRGYKGRFALGEVVLGQVVRSLEGNAITRQSVRGAIQQAGGRTLFQKALEAVVRGEISLTEALPLQHI